MAEKFTADTKLHYIIKFGICKRKFCKKHIF